MSHIKDEFAKINNLKISLSKTIDIHAFNNLNLYFQLYLANLSYSAQKKQSS